MTEPACKENDVRRTPDSLYLPLHTEFRFDLDAAASHENAKCKLYWTEQGLGRGGVIIAPGNGLTGTWQGSRVFINPPFSQLGLWVNKAWFSSAELVVMVVPGGRTEQGWWHEYVEPWRDGNAPPAALAPWASFKTRNLKGRTRFLDATGKSLDKPKFGCTLLIWSK